MSDAIRAIKIFDNFSNREAIAHQMDFAHYAFVLERHSQSNIGLLPRYYHMGHSFLPPKTGKKDGDNAYVIGNYFIVQEYIESEKFVKSKCTDLMIEELVQKVKMTHVRTELAIGDMNRDNLRISGDSIRVIDCDYGSNEKSNKNYRKDLKSLESLFDSDWIEYYHDLKVSP